jgi:RHS repeat-associated protein
MLGNMTAETIAPGTPLATTTTYAYDVLGRVVTTTSPDGLVTTNTYHPSSGRLISVNKASAAGASQPFSYTTTYTYDDNYGLTRTTHPDGSYDSLTYNFPKRQLTQKSSHSSNGITVYRETYTYNTLGQLSTRTDGANRVTTYFYDAYGRNHKIRRADNREQTTTYDYASNPMTVNGYDGLVAQIRHDIFGRTVSTNHPDGSSTASYEPGPGGQVLDSTVSGVTTSHTYDVIGRVVSTNTGNTQTTHAYNPAMRQHITTSAGRSTVTTHDAAGRVSMVQTGPAIQVTAYSRSGGLYIVTSATDPAGLNLQSTTTYDGLGRKVADTDANGDTTTYAYDGRDRMLSYTNARGHTFSFQYDAAGRRIKRTEPDGTWQSHTYDFAGNLTSHRKADGVLLTHTYNVLNQPVSQTSSSGGSYVNWTYDALGRLTSMENQDVILGYAYLSGSSRIVTETTTIKGLANLNRITTLAYDAQARPAGFSRAGVFNVSYAHGSNGRISSVTNDTAPPLASYAYDAAGLPIGITHENGLFTSWTRDSAGRTTSVATATAGNAVRSSVSHTYDGASRRRSATYEDALGQAYGYDAAGQVTAAKVGIVNPAIANPGVSPTHAYAYDKAGNRNSSLAFGQSTTYASSSVNAYTSISGGGFQAPSPTYDPNGNTLTLPRPDGSSQALTWDAFDRLRSASNTQSQISKVYDPLGRLVWIRSIQSGQTAKDEIWSWTGWTLLTREVRQGSTTLDTFRYIWGPDLSTTLEGAGGVGGLLAIEHAPGNSTTWDIRYVHYDANGNVIALTDSSGSTSARYRYSPFGELIASEDLDNSGWNDRNIHRFSTKPEVTGTGLLYYGYRYYDPKTGKWPSRDPIEEEGGVNLYGFVGNDGVNRWDYLGQYGPMVIPIAGGAILLTAADILGITACACLVSPPCLDLVAQLTEEAIAAAAEAARCAAARAACIASCTASTLPTGNYGGNRFHKCFRECMDDADCNM